MEPTDLLPGSPSRKSASPSNETTTITSIAHKPPPRDLLQEKRKSLCKGPWALDEALFHQHFGNAPYESRWFLEGLISLSKFQPDFTAAWQVLETTYKSEHIAGTLLPGNPSQWVWNRADVNHAMEALVAPTDALGSPSNERAKRKVRKASNSAEVEKLDSEPSSNSGDVSAPSVPTEPDQAPSKDVPEMTAKELSEPSAATAPLRTTPGRRLVRTEGTRQSPRFTLQRTLTDKVCDITDKDRQEFASSLIKIITDQTREVVKSGNLILQTGNSADGFGLSLGLAVEFEIYLNYWGSETKASPQYEAKIQTIAQNISKNAQLRNQVLTEIISPKHLCIFSPEDLAKGFAEKGNSPEKANRRQIDTKTDQSIQKIKKRPSRSAINSTKEKPNKKGFKEAAAKIRYNKSGQAIKKGKKRVRSEEIAEVQDGNTSDEAALLNKTKEEKKRIQGLNLIMKEYVQPDQEDVAVSYLDTCLVLPPNAPLGWPHLIDLSTLSEVDTTGLHVADMVVTILHNHNPDTLSRFMDMSHGFTFHVKELASSEEHDFLIVRTTMTVTCGFVDQGRRWSVKHRYGLRATPMATWTPLCLEEYMGEELAECVMVDDVVTVMVAGETLAYEMLKEKAWIPAEGARIHVRNSAAWRS